jgi:hypothetical protein
MYNFNDSEMLIESAHNTLIKYYASKFKCDLNKATAEVYKSKTYKHLIIPTTEFYSKSDEELCYLLDLELKGDMETWMRQGNPLYI